MKRRLLCILSDQQIPNVLAAIHFKPDVVHMVIADDFAAWEEKLKCFQDATRFGGFDAVRVEALHVPRQDDVATATAEVNRLFGAHADSAWHVLLNGGTKPLAGAVQAAAQARADVPLLYMNMADATQFIDLRNPEQVIHIETRVSVTTFFKACGFEVLPSKTTLDERLILPAQELAASGKGHFWKLERKDENGNEQPEESWLPFPWRKRQTLLDAIRASVLKEKDFLTGKWLEYLAYSWLDKCYDAQLIDNLKFSITVAVPRDATWWAGHRARENELDVVFTARNKLYWIECKTRRRQRNDDEDDDLLLDFYKAVAVTYGLHATGVRAAFMHSNAPLTSNNIRERAEQFNIALFGKSAVQNIGSALLNGERHPLRTEFEQWLSAP